MNPFSDQNVNRRPVQSLIKVIETKSNNSRVCKTNVTVKEHLRSRYKRCRDTSIGKESILNYLQVAPKLAKLQSKKTRKPFQPINTNIVKKSKKPGILDYVKKRDYEKVCDIALSKLKISDQPKKECEILCDSCQEKSILEKSLIEIEKEQNVSKKKIKPTIILISPSPKPHTTKYINQCENYLLNDSTEDQLSPKILDSNMNKSNFCALDYSFFSTYEYEIYKDLLSVEKNYNPPINYLIKYQGVITVEMRSLVVDWMMEMCEKFELSQEAVALSINIFDRFLYIIKANREKLQLIAATCLLIANKFSESLIPNLPNLCIISRNSFTVNQILEMERLVLSTINFRILNNCINWFINYFLFKWSATKRHCFMAHYLTEITMTYSSVYLKYRPSAICAASVLLSANVFNGNVVWNENMILSTGYRVTQFYHVLCDIYSLWSSRQFCRNLSSFDKYSKERYGSVSLLPIPSKVPTVDDLDDQVYQVESDFPHGLKKSEQVPSKMSNSSNFKNCTQFTKLKPKFDL
ncbi:CycA3 [Intoshia linei]|uniref:CycA3 n=1 Tax=Intoshia linei TaxID=1819745 RepID=A0A177BBH8_9BILA|nr:CycA3 [Intoshia linei]